MPSSPLTFALKQHIGNLELDATVPKADIIWTYMDSFPSGRNHDFVIMSICEYDKHFYVLGIDTIKGSGYGQDFNKNTAIVRMHLTKLMDLYAHCKFAIIPEIHDMSMNIYCLDVIRFFEENKMPERLYMESALPSSKVYGVFTTNNMRIHMLSKLEKLLADSRISLSNNLPIDIEQLLIAQLERTYRCPNMLSTNQKRASSVQVIGDDDLAMSLMAICHYPSIIENNNPDFDDWASQYSAL